MVTSSATTQQISSNGLRLVRILNIEFRNFKPLFVAKFQIQNKKADHRRCSPGSAPIAMPKKDSDCASLFDLIEWFPFFYFTYFILSSDPAKTTQVKSATFRFRIPVTILVSIKFKITKTNFWNNQNSVTIKGLNYPRRPISVFRNLVTREARTFPPDMVRVLFTPGGAVIVCISSIDEPNYQAQKKPQWKCY